MQALQHAAAPADAVFNQSFAFCQCLTHRISRCDAGGGANKPELLDRRQRAAVERGGEGGAPGVGDLVEAEVEPLEVEQCDAAARVAHPASVISVPTRSSSLSCFSPPAGGGGVPAGGGGGATRAARPSSPNGL